MKKWLLPGTIALALVLAVAGGTFALAGGFDDGDDQTDTAGEQEGDAARCAEGAEDCDDTSSGDIDPALGVCIAEDDPLYDPSQPCNDTVVDGEGSDGSLNMCIPGVEDCDDMVEGSEGCPADDIENCKARLTEQVFADLETRVDSTAAEITVVSVEETEWPDACLGVEQPDVACAQVITPGFKIVLEQNGAQYQYHTDRVGNFVFAAGPLTPQ